ncbi:MAG: NnrU family protein [Magnetovibrio sp.]|nr:NnrU family protein [Magnetovibrio sp.]
MTNLFFALAVFIAFHIIPAIGPLRRALVVAVGVWVYVLVYSALSIAILVWVGTAYVEADTDILWSQWPWTRWVPLLVMPVVCVLLVGTFSEPNALSVGVKADKFDPKHPGVVSITRHPLTWGMVLWAGAHLFPNGDSSSLMLFGLFAVLGLIGPWSLDRKKRQDLGEDEWRRLSVATSSIPFWAIISGKTRLDWRSIGWKRLTVALAIYLALIGLHPYLIGMSPLPI